MKTLAPVLALMIAMPLSATAGGLTADTATAADGTTVNALGCLVKPILGSDGTPLYWNAVDPDAAACAVPGDGPDGSDLQNLIAALTPDPVEGDQPGDTPDKTH